VRLQLVAFGGLSRFAVRVTHASQMPCFVAVLPWNPWFGHLNLLHWPQHTNARSRHPRESQSISDQRREHVEHVKHSNSGAFRIRVETTAEP